MSIMKKKSHYIHELKMLSLVYVEADPTETELCFARYKGSSIGPPEVKCSHNTRGSPN